MSTQRLTNLDHWQIAQAIAEGRYFVSNSPEVGLPWDEVEGHLNEAGWTVEVSDHRRKDDLELWGSWECGIYCPVSKQTTFALGESRQEAFKLCYLKMKIRTGGLGEKFQDALRSEIEAKKLEGVFRDLMQRDPLPVARKGRL